MAVNCRETGELAKQVDGAVLVRYGDTAVLSTAVAGNNPTNLDYFPLSVAYQEKCMQRKNSSSFLRRRT